MRDSVSVMAKRKAQTAPVTEDFAPIATRLKALADPTRMHIMNLLSAGASLTVFDITAKLTVTQPTVSHHLRELEHAGFVKKSKAGQWTHVTSNPDAVEHVTAQAMYVVRGDAAP